MQELGLYTASAVENFFGENDCIDYLEGCLIDNLLYYHPKTGKYYLCKEHALNAWQSCYKVFSEGGNGLEIFEMWGQTNRSRTRNSITKGGKYNGNKRIFRLYR